MAAGTTGHLDPQPDAVLVVVDPHLDHLLDQATGGALVPEALTAAAEVVGLTGGDCFFESLAVHHRDHQQFARGMVGGDTGNEALLVELGGQFGPLLDLLDRNTGGKEGVGGG